MSLSVSERRAAFLGAAVIIAVGTAYRCLVLFSPLFLREFEGDDGVIYFHLAYLRPGVKALLTGDNGYYPFLTRFLSVFLVKTVGVVDSFPLVFKVAGTLLYTASCSILLSRRFSFIGSFTVRTLLAWLLVCLPGIHLTLPYNAAYAFSFVLIYFLIGDPEASPAPTKSAIVLSGLALVLAAIAKPVELAFLPLCGLAAVMAHRNGNRSQRILCGLAIAALLIQAAYIGLSGPARSVTIPFPSIGLTIENWLAVSGYGSLAFLLPRTAAVNAVFMWAVGLGAILNFGWAATALHSVRRNGWAASLPHFIPLLVLLPLVFVVGTGFERLWGMTFSYREQFGDVYSRHTYVPFCFSLMSTLAMARYWLAERGGRRAEIAVAATLAFGLLVNLGGRVGKVPMAEKESASNWQLFRPMLRRASYCIPTHAFPGWVIRRDCGLVRQGTIGAGRWPGTVGIGDSPRVQLLVVQWEAEMPSRKTLELLIKKKGVVVRTLSPLTFPHARFQHFDLASVPRDVDSLQLRALGDAAVTAAAQYFLYATPPSGNGNPLAVH